MPTSRPTAERVLRFWRVYQASLRIESAHLRTQVGFLFLSSMAAVSLLVMVSLFSLTGSFAPVAVVNEDGAELSRQFVREMAEAHHSFSIHEMNEHQAEEALRETQMVAIVKIPASFSDEVKRGGTAAIDVKIDNINLDLTQDIQRALPTAILGFGRKHGFEGVRLTMQEHDVMPEDTGYTSYLAVSALALDAMIIASVIGAMAISREWEQLTIRSLQLSPDSLAPILLGKITVASLFSAFVLGITLLILVFGYGVVPRSVPAAIAGLLACTVIFSSFGAWLGALCKRVAVVLPLVFGLSIPFYIASGALEPARFDGEGFWRLAHLSPVYYAVGILEWGFHGLHVTTEPIAMDLAILIASAVLIAWLTVLRLSRGGRR